MTYYLPYNAPKGFDWIVRLAGWQAEADAVYLTLETAHGEQPTLIVRVVTADIWRLTFLPPGVEAPIQTPIVSGTFGEGVPLRTAETESSLTISGPSLALRVDRNPWAVHLLDRNGDTVLRENPNDVDGLGRPFILPLGYVRGEQGITTVTELFHLWQDEHLFGLGEKFTPLDKVSQRIITWTQDAFGSTSERSHKNIPFLLSTRGYGLLIDSGARITWELGTVSCQSYQITAETNALDMYLIYGPAPAEVLARYADLTGHAPLPPKWSFGLWLSSAGTYRDQPAIEKLVEETESAQLPADVIHIDTWWLRWRQYCDFRWDREAFPEVEQLIADIHARGQKVTLWEHPYISVESDLFEVGRREGYFVRRPNGEVYVIEYGLSLAPRPDGIVRIATPETSWNAPVAIIDFTNPAAYAWFQDLHRPVLKMGIDAFKTDFGEDIPHDAVFANGQTGATMHNLYPLLYNQAVYEVTLQERGEGLVWARSGTAGNQRYPVCWSGDPAADFDSLACTIRGGLSIGLSGVPFWSNDIGAYRGMPTPRLFVRWAQFGLFCSHSRMHGDSPREPWYFGEEAAQIVHRFVTLRYQLFPYLYSTAYEATRTGLPVLRAMPLAFPSDPNAYGKDLQYLFGPWLLVAPIYDEGEQREVYLPAGTWFDFWTGKTYSGPQTLTVHAPLDTIPLFVRAGAILPMMEPAQRIPTGQVDPLIVQVYPGSEFAYQLAEDEGRTQFRCQSTADKIDFWLDTDVSRRLILRFRAGQGRE